MLSVHTLQITDDETFNRLTTSFPQEPRGPFLPVIIALHFATVVNALRTLDLVMTQQLYTGMNDWGHLVAQ